MRSRTLTVAVSYIPEYNSDDADDMIPSPPSHNTVGCHLPSPSFIPTGLQPSSCSYMGGERQERLDPQIQCWNLDSSAFFWTQLQKEEAHLREISDAVLLSTDEHGRT